MSNQEVQPQSRGLSQFVLDRFFSWLTGYPPERCSYTTKAVRIPISDGLSRFELAGDLLQPTGTEVLGTILLRSPYGRSFPIAIGVRAFAARGYQVLCVSCRGTFDSGGDFDAGRTEVEDGKAVVEWMRKQPWYTGTFATFGGSYLGFVQWALLCDPPDDLVVAAPVIAPHDFSRLIWETGALSLDIVRWAEGVALQEQYSILRRALLPPRKIGPVLNSMPFAQNLRKHLGDGSPWLDQILATPDRSDPHYTAMKLDRALDRVGIPTLIVTGWYDLVNEQSMEQYTRLKERGVNVALTIGPWNHLQSGLSAEQNRDNFNWIEQHLAGKAEARRTSNVRYFVTGSKQWKELEAFPPPTTTTTLYLNDAGRLTSNQPTTSSTSSFVFDPSKPTPAIGGNGLELGGIADDTALSKRTDVLTFTSETLMEDIEICGQPTFSLSHATDTSFADIFVRISEVDEKGKSTNVTDVYRRLGPKRNCDDKIALMLHHCSHRFFKSKRIRVYIAGGCFPQYARNHGVENLNSNAVEMHAVKHVVYHDANRLSEVILPVLTE